MRVGQGLYQERNGGGREAGGREKGRPSQCRGEHDRGCPRFVPAAPRPWMILLKMGMPVFRVKQGPQRDMLKS